MEKSTISLNCANCWRRRERNSEPTRMGHSPGLPTLGSRVVERMHGMFAFVIWDRVRHAAFGARDRLGIKPLSWAMHRGALSISSTLEPFHVLDEFNRIDLTALRSLMSFDYIPAPHTILSGVQKLEPGTRFTWSFGDSEPALERYWKPPVENSTL